MAKYPKRRDINKRFIIKRPHIARKLTARNGNLRRFDHIPWDF